MHTICPRSNQPFYIITHYIKWVILGHRVYFEYIKKFPNQELPDRKQDK